MSTLDTIRNIFYSGTHSFKGNMELISEIAFLVDKNFLSVSPFKMASKDEYKILLNNPAKLKLFDEAAGGGIPHVALKIIAAEYLKTKKGHESKFEHPFCGYYPDVLSKDESIAVECGHTNNPDKMLAYFKEGGIKECIQIPYPTYEDKEITAYSFVASDDLTKFLHFMDEEKISTLKAIFFKKDK